MSLKRRRNILNSTKRSNQFCQILSLMYVRISIDCLFIIYPPNIHQLWRREMLFFNTPITEGQDIYTAQVRICICKTNFTFSTNRFIFQSLWVALIGQLNILLVAIIGSTVLLLTAAIWRCRISSWNFVSLSVVGEGPKLAQQSSLCHYCLMRRLGWVSVSAHWEQKALAAPTKSLRRRIYIITYCTARDKRRFCCTTPPPAALKLYSRACGCALRQIKRMSS
jgi:hypothetical protein